VLDLAVKIRCEAPPADDAIGRLLDVFRTLPLDPVGAHCRYDLRVDERGEYTLDCDAIRLAFGAAWEEMASALVVDLNGRAIDSFHGFAVHAGVVARNEAVVAFPGESGAGKSTLTAACVAAGFAYVSDEALCIRNEGERVVAYPKPIALSPQGWAMIGSRVAARRGVDDGEKVMMSADQLGACVADSRRGLRLAHVVALVRAGGAPRLTTLPRAHALASLLRMSFNHYKDPRRAFDLVSRLAADTQAWQLEYSDPRAAAELLRAQLHS
jgi:hypothetical protein